MVTAADKYFYLMMMMMMMIAASHGAALLVSAVASLGTLLMLLLPGTTLAGADTPCSLNVSSLNVFGVFISNCTLNITSPTELTHCRLEHVRMISSIDALVVLFNCTIDGSRILVKSDSERDGRAAAGLTVAVSHSTITCDDTFDVFVAGSGSYDHRPLGVNVSISNTTFINCVSVLQTPSSWKHILYLYVHVANLSFTVAVVGAADYSRKNSIGAIVNVESEFEDNSSLSNCHVVVVSSNFSIDMNTASNLVSLPKMNVYGSVMIRMEDIHFKSRLHVAPYDLVKQNYYSALVYVYTKRIYNSVLHVSCTLCRIVMTSRSSTHSTKGVAAVCFIAKVGDGRPNNVTTHNATIAFILSDSHLTLHAVSRTYGFLMEESSGDSTNVSVQVRRSTINMNISGACYMIQPTTAGGFLDVGQSCVVRQAVLIMLIQYYTTLVLFEVSIAEVTVTSAIWVDYESTPPSPLRVNRMLATVAALLYTPTAQSLKISLCDAVLHANTLSTVQQNLFLTHLSVASAAMVTSADSLLDASVNFTNTALHVSGNVSSSIITQGEVRDLSLLGVSTFFEGSLGVFTNLHCVLSFGASVLRSAHIRLANCSLTSTSTSHVGLGAGSLWASSLGLYKASMLFLSENLVSPVVLEIMSFVASGNSHLMLGHQNNPANLSISLNNVCFVVDAHLLNGFTTNGSQSALSHITAGVLLSGITIVAADRLQDAPHVAVDNLVLSYSWVGVVVRQQQRVVISHVLDATNASLDRVRWLAHNATTLPSDDLLPSTWLSFLRIANCTWRDGAFAAQRIAMQVAHDPSSVPLWSIIRLQNNSLLTTFVWWFVFNNVTITSVGTADYNATLFPNNYDNWDNTTRVYAGCSVVTAHANHFSSPQLRHPEVPPYLHNIPSAVLQRSPGNLYLSRLFPFLTRREGEQAVCRSFGVITESRALESRTPVRHAGTLMHSKTPSSIPETDARKLPSRQHTGTATQPPPDPVESPLRMRAWIDVRVQSPSFIAMAVASAVAAGSALAVGAAADSGSSASQLLVLASMLDSECLSVQLSSAPDNSPRRPQDEGPTHVDMKPTQYLLSPFAALGPSIAAMGNIGATATVFGCHWAVTQVLYYRRRHAAHQHHSITDASHRRATAWGAACVSAQFPNWSMHAAMFFLPGTLQFAVKSFPTGSRALGVSAGVCGLLYVVVVLLVLARFLRRVSSELRFVELYLISRSSISASRKQPLGSSCSSCGSVSGITKDDVKSTRSVSYSDVGRKHHDSVRALQLAPSSLPQSSSFASTSDVTKKKSEREYLNASWRYWLLPIGVWMPDAKRNRFGKLLADCNVHSRERWFLLPALQLAVQALTALPVHGPLGCGIVFSCVVAVLVFSAAYLLLGGGASSSADVCCFHLKVSTRTRCSALLKSLSNVLLATLAAVFLIQLVRRESTPEDDSDAVSTATTVIAMLLSVVSVASTVHTIFVVVYLARLRRESETSPEVNWSTTSIGLEVANKITDATRAGCRSALTAHVPPASSAPHPPPLLPSKHTADRSVSTGAFSVTSQRCFPCAEVPLKSTCVSTSRARCGTIDVPAAASLLHLQLLSLTAESYTNAEVLARLDVLVRIACDRQRIVVHDDVSADVDF